MAVSKKDAERAKNMFALGLLSWMYSRPLRVDPHVPASASSPPGPSWSRPTSRPSRPAGTSARRPRTSASGTRSSRPRCRRATTATSPVTGAGAGPGGRPGARRSCRCSSARTRSPRPRTSCTSCPSTSGSTSPRCRPRTRSPRSARRWAPPTAVRSASPHQRPGRRAQGRDHLAGDRAGAAAAHHRRAAGRPVDRHADQDRAGRPQHGAVRSARRGAGRGDRAEARRRTASTPRSRRPGSR